MNIEQEMRDLIAYLNYHTTLYDMGKPVISDADWDSHYFQLKHIEEQTGIILPMSPTQKIVYNVVSELKKVTHNHPMLSLDKTKDISDIKAFFKNKDYIGMLKMDGLTCSLRYSGGRLVSAETRGDGTVGEDVTHNAMVISNIPKIINYKDELIIDGEIICKYDDFEEFSDTYKNPRNFASGSIRLLDSKECAKRKLNFVAWDCISSIDYTLDGKLLMLKGFGFTVVPFEFANDEIVNNLIKIAKEYKYPIDGIVFKFNNCQYYDSLGRTDHHFKGGMALKFEDETADTKLVNIEWQLGRTGILTPVAIYEDVELEGSTCNKASLHNISVMNKTLGNAFVGEEISIAKMNMIIPQIVKAKTEAPNNANFIPIPNQCPICNKDTIIKDNDGIKTLYCNNPNCGGKSLKKIEHYCSKGRMEIKGLSEKTIEKLMDWGWLTSIKDLYTLYNYSEEWYQKDGFGIKSVNKICEAISESTKNVDLSCFIAALGIPLIGRTVSKELVKHIDSWDDFMNKIDSGFDFTSIEGFGYEMNASLLSFDYTEAKEIALLYLDFAEPKEEENTNKTLEGITVVVTGKLKHFKNRDELKSKIESYGGKVAGSISSKTNYLLTNDASTGTAKNKKAAELGIEIITEGDFISKFF